MACVSCMNSRTFKIPNEGGPRTEKSGDAGIEPPFSRGVVPRAPFLIPLPSLVGMFSFRGPQVRGLRELRELRVLHEFENQLIIKLRGSTNRKKRRRGNRTPQSLGGGFGGAIKSFYEDGRADL